MFPTNQCAVNDCGKHDQTHVNLDGIILLLITRFWVRHGHTALRKHDGLDGFFLFASLHTNMNNENPTATHINNMYAYDLKAGLK